MFHLAAFSGAKTDSTANEAVPRVADGALSVSGSNNYLSPDNLSIFAALVYNDTIARARIVAPSLRNEGLPEIFPLNATAEPSVDFRYSYWDKMGPMLRKDEEFGVETSNGASTVDNCTALLWLRRVFKPTPNGKRFTIRATSAQTLVANAWTLGGLTFDQTLPFGRYSVIGMAATCNDAHAVRILFPRDQSYRPGVGCGETIAIRPITDYFRAGEQGEWGRFESVNATQLEILGGTAGAETAAVILDLVRLDSGVE